MSDNIAVHSDKHFEYLMEDSENETLGLGNIQRDVGRPVSSSTDTKSQKFDMLTLGEGKSADIESHYEVDENTDIKFVNKERSSMLETAVDEDNIHVDRDDEVDRLEELKRHYKKLEEDFGNMERTGVADSLEMPDFGHELEGNEPPFHFDQDGYLSHAGESHFQKQENVQDNHNDLGNQRKRQVDLGEDTARKDFNPKPGFKYKEPVPKFIAKNRIKVGKKSQGSYCQKFLSEKRGSNEIENRAGDNTSCLPLQSNRSDILPIENYELKQKRDIGLIMQPEVRNKHFVEYENDFVPKERNTHVMMPQNPTDTNRFGEDIQISRLDNMIKEEELNLKNNILDSSMPHIVDDYNSEMQYSSGYLQAGSYPIQNKCSVTENVEPMLHQWTNHLSIQKEEDTRNSSYAKRHYLNIDKQNTSPNDGQTSYAAQHLGKKKEVSYKKYSLKDYKALNKEIKLQRSLGPDKASEEYLEKKSRADKLKDYASAVSSYNKQRLVVKKAKSAPMPTIKDRQLESKRTAALEYARSIKIGKGTRRLSNGQDQVRSSSEKSDRVSALEIMKQRHETEKLAIEKMRQNLANIIKEVKS
ncbi:uncharacterized protein LOC135684157 [Rhopilema esculentum]|uniref:uncharacterized protein LOC135684157 n=1 Tax=Rhopilema esculentum TaxID=499914 RepID=UPI0031DAF906|eukprot:gene16670-8109_t